MTASDSATHHGESAWRRLLRKIAQFEQAMETTADDIQDLRIDRLERDLQVLKTKVSESLRAGQATPDA